jgi:hypothetical protein
MPLQAQQRLTLQLVHVVSKVVATRLRGGLRRVVGQQLEEGQKWDVLLRPSLQASSRVTSVQILV